MKLNTFLFLLLSLFWGMGCQEIVEDINPLKKTSKSIGGNGEGFDGIRVLAPMVVQGGDTVKVQAVGGSGKYDFSLEEGAGEITVLSDDLILYTAPVMIYENKDIVIKAVDTEGKEGYARFMVAKIEAPERGTHFTNRYTQHHFGYFMAMAGGQAIVFNTTRFDHLDQSKAQPSTSMMFTGEIYIFEEETSVDENKWKLSQSISIQELWPHIKGDYHYSKISHFKTDGEWMAVLVEGNRVQRDQGIVQYPDYDQKKWAQIVLYKKNSLGVWKYRQKVFNPLHGEKNYWETRNIHLERGKLFVPTIGEKSYYNSPTVDQIQVYEMNEKEEWGYTSTIQTNGSTANFGMKMDLFKDNYIVIKDYSDVKIYKRKDDASWKHHQTLKAPKTKPRGFKWNVFAKNVLASEKNLFVTGYGYRSDGRLYIYSFENDKFELVETVYQNGGVYGYALTALDDKTVAVSAPATRPGTDYKAYTRDSFYEFRLDLMTSSKDMISKGTRDPTQGLVFIYKIHPDSGRWKLFHTFKDTDINYEYLDFFGQNLSGEGNNLLIANPREKFLNVYKIPADWSKGEKPAQE